MKYLFLFIILFSTLYTSAMENLLLISRYSDEDGFDTIENAFHKAGKKNVNGIFEFKAEEFVATSLDDDFLEYTVLNGGNAEQLWHKLEMEYNQQLKKEE